MPTVAEKIIAALKAKGTTPRQAIKDLGLDESILSRENLMTTRPTKLAAASLLVIKRGVEPLLAMDATVDLLPIVADLTSKNFKAKDVTERVRKALAGKTIAKDAPLDHVEGGLATLEQPHEHTLDESVSEEQHNAMAAAAKGHSNLGIPRDVGQEFLDADRGHSFDRVAGFLRDRGLSRDDIEQLRGLMPENAAEDRRRADDRARAMDVHHYHGARDESEEEEERRRREKAAEDKCMSDDSMKGRDAKHHHHYASDESEEESEEERKKREAKDRRAAKDKKMVGKDEMDAAIAAAVKGAQERERGIRLALDKVRPYVGELRSDLAFDSAADVYRHALKAKGVANVDAIQEVSALETILGYQAPLNAPTRDAGGGGHRPLALDASAAKGFNDRFPEAKRIERA